jgi:GTP:adenosylcobinamide-phosphate guanylyltransferase
MIQWVLDAVSESTFINRVVVVGLEEDIPLYCTKPMTILPQQGGLFENLLAAVKTLQKIEPLGKKVIAISSDIPVLKGFMLDWFVDEVLKSDDEVYYTVISRKTMESRFPQARRSYYQLKDVEVCGADVHAFDVQVITHRPLLWQKLFATRKKCFQTGFLDWL